MNEPAYYCYLQPGFISAGEPGQIPGHLPGSDTQDQIFPDPGPSHNFELTRTIIKNFFNWKNHQFKMQKAEQRKINKNTARDLSGFDKDTIFWLLDSGILNIKPMKLSRDIFDKEILEKFQPLIEKGLIVIVPNKFDSKNTYEDLISIIKWDIEDLKERVPGVVNCPDTDKAWEIISNQGRKLDQIIRELKGIQKTIYKRCTELHDMFEEPIKKSTHIEP